MGGCFVRFRLDRARPNDSRTGTEQLSKRYFQDRAPSPRPIRGYAVVRAGLITIAWPFLFGLEAIRRLVRQALKPFNTRKKKPRQAWGRGVVGVLAGQFGGLKVLRGIDLHALSSFPESETDSCDGHHIFTFFHRL